MEPGCEQYCERELDEVERRGGRVYFHLGAWRDGQWSSSRRLGHAPHSSHWPPRRPNGGPVREARSDPRGPQPGLAVALTMRFGRAGPGGPTRGPGSAGLPPTREEPGSGCRVGRWCLSVPHLRRNWEGVGSTAAPAPAIVPRAEGGRVRGGLGPRPNWVLPQLPQLVEDRERVLALAPQPPVPAEGADQQEASGHAAGGDGLLDRKTNHTQRRPWGMSGA
jgi:hypothetical protein